MKKFIGALVIAGAFIATPAFAQVDTSTTTPAFIPGGHASDSQMQNLLSPEGYQTYLNGKSVSVSSKNGDIISLIKHLIALLQQELDLTNSAN